MNILKKAAMAFLSKYGAAAAACAFACVFVSANSPCTGPFYEPDEPAGIERFKRMNK